MPAFAFFLFLISFEQSAFDCFRSKCAFKIRQSDAMKKKTHCKAGTQRKRRQNFFTRQKQSSEFHHCVRILVQFSVEINEQNFTENRASDYERSISLKNFLKIAVTWILVISKTTY